MSILENMDAKIDALAAHVKDGLGLIAAMAKTMEDWNKPKPEWESMSTAEKTRRTAAKTLRKAVKANLIRTKLGPPAQGGKCPVFLFREDLDRHFPVH